MNSASWWTSISSLERLSSFLQWSVAIGGVCLLIVSHRIEALRADRAFTHEQKQSIADNLRGKPAAPFWIKSYPETSESNEYGRQLEKILQQTAQWSVPGHLASEPLPPFPIQSGEEPTTGITIMVDGRHGDTVTNGKNLETALRSAQIEDVKLEVRETSSDPLVSTWVFIKVGKNANQ